MKVNQHILRLMPSPWAAFPPHKPTIYPVIIISTILILEPKYAQEAVLVHSVCFNEGPLIGL